MAPLLPGIANATNKTPISQGAQHLYTFNWLYCFLVSLLSYFVVSKVWPARETMIPETVPGIIDNSVEGTQEEKPDKSVDESVQEKGDAKA